MCDDFFSVERPEREWLPQRMLGVRLLIIERDSRRSPRVFLHRDIIRVKFDRQERQIVDVNWYLVGKVLDGSLGFHALLS